MTSAVVEAVTAFAGVMHLKIQVLIARQSVLSPANPPGIGVTVLTAPMILAWREVCMRYAMIARLYGAVTLAPPNDELWSTLTRGSTEEVSCSSYE
jgi:hypothetical protein